MKLYYSPFFTGACYRKLPVGEACFEKIVGDAGLLDYLELRLGLFSSESETIERILAYRKALEDVKEDAFYKDAFKTDPLATAKEILRWRDALVMEGFNAETEYRSARLKKLAEAEREFSRSGLVGTPERWKQVHALARDKDAGAKIVVCHDMALLPKLVRETLEAFGVAEGLYDGLGKKDLPLDTEGKDITILQFGTVAEAYRWAVDNNDCEAVVCPDPFRLNAVLRNKEKPLLDASAGGDSSITQLFRLGMSLLERPLNVKNLLEYLRAPVSPIPGKTRGSLAFALKREGGRGEEWEKALDNCNDKAETERFLLSLLNADVSDGRNLASVVTDWCQAVEDWVPTVMNEVGKPYLMELIGLCRSMCRVIGNESPDIIDDKFVMKAVKTLYNPKPVQTVKAMAGGWDAVDSHRSLIDAPESLLWLPCNGGLGTAWPYSFMLQEELDELKVKEMSDFVKYDFNLMVKQLGQVGRIVLCACDYDCDEALEEHPAVTLCKAAAKEKDMRSEGNSALSVFSPLRTIETGVDLYPKRKKEEGEEKEPEEDIALSATSIETLIGYPFDFVMDKKLGFQDLSSLRMSDLIPTQGTVAHYVFERMLKESGGEIRVMRSMLEAGEFEKRVNSAAEKKGAILLQLEYKTLFSHFKETVQRSIGVLLDILEASGLTPKDSEVKLDEDLKDLSHITGSVDFYAETKDRDIVVIDFKYSRGRTYIEKLKKDKSIQLDIYAESLAAKLHRPVVAKAYYFFPINQLYTDAAPGLFCEHGCVHRLKKKSGVSPLSTRIRNSVDYRRTQIKAGKLEIEEGYPADKIDYHIHVVEKDMIDIPTKKDGKTKETVKENAPFVNPTKYPILKSNIK